MTVGITRRSIGAPLAFLVVCARAIIGAKCVNRLPQRRDELVDSKPADGRQEKVRSGMSRQRINKAIGVDQIGFCVGNTPRLFQHTPVKFGQLVAQRLEVFTRRLARAINGKKQ